MFSPLDTVDPALQRSASGQLAACHLHGVIGETVPRSPHPSSVEAEAAGEASGGEGAPGA